ncbi:hypothetical protein [Bacillus cereus]|uniref:hypothetical protein n=1 Tax=Bacillus cereus TaxID=1396 RepID=UPI00222315EA|nr:hypothetical protein [Bacillus cereus]
MVQKKRIICNFFYFEEPEGGEGKINALFETQKNIIDNAGVTNIQVSYFYLRITYLEKRIDEDKQWWVGIVERLETTEEVESSNLVGERNVYASGDDEGPIKNTGFVYYPYTKTLVLHRKIGGVNDYNFGIFIRKLLKQLKVVNKGFTKYKMHLLPDLHKLDRLNKAPHIHSLEYSFKLPEKIDKVASENRSIFGDLFLAERLGGSHMKVAIKSDKMNVKETIQKVLKIKALGDDNVNTLKVVTEHNNIEEPLDLLNSKFTDFKDVELKKGKKETPSLVMDTINEIFNNQRILIENMYINKEEEE